MTYSHKTGIERVVFIREKGASLCVLAFWNWRYQGQRFIWAGVIRADKVPVHLQGIKNDNNLLSQHVCRRLIIVVGNDIRKRSSEHRKYCYAHQNPNH